MIFFRPSLVTALKPWNTPENLIKIPVNIDASKMHTHTQNATMRYNNEELI